MSRKGGEGDAGEADAGEVDAGEEDAGEVDAGEEDAGEVDAGPINQSSLLSQLADNLFNNVAHISTFPKRRETCPWAKIHLH